MSPHVDEDHPILLFDGVCNLCNRYVQFVVERDDADTFRFASLQSDVGHELLEAHGLPTGELESVVLIEDGEAYRKSSAVLRVARQLGGVYGLLWPFRFVPSRLRDLAYDFVANRRYGWFGKRDQCMVPSGDLESRFLE